MPDIEDPPKHGLSCGCNVDGAAPGKRMAARETKQCLQACKQVFLESISADWTESSGWDKGCQALTGHSPDSRLWDLYRCDSKFCGVAIIQIGGLQQDPNVDLIINTCQNIGFSSVLDPGPPPTEYTCDEGPCSRTRMWSGPDNPTATAGGSYQASVVKSSYPTITQSWFTSTVSATAVTRSSSDHSSATPAALGAGKVGQSSQSTASSSSLSGSSKAAIAVCSVLGLVILSLLALLCLRRRRKSKAAFPERGLRSRLRLGRNGPRSGSPRPLLISPAHSTAGSIPSPLTPPLRLRDRRFLPSILRSRDNRSPSPPLTPLTPAYSSTHNSALFPTSPLYSPTVNKLVPRQEAGGRASFPRAYNGGLPPIPPQIAFGVPSGPAHGYHASRGSMGSSSFGANSLTGGHPSSLRNEVQAVNYNSISGAPPPPLPPPISSPTRPPRPHDFPLEIPDLVSPNLSSQAMTLASSLPPLGPPPSRALPSPPPPPPPSPLSSVASPVSGRSSPGPLLRSLTRSGASHYDSAASATAVTPRDLEDVAEEDYHGNYPRQSWDSWSETGPGMDGGGESRIALLLASPSSPAPSSPAKQSRNSTGGGGNSNSGGNNNDGINAAGMGTIVGRERGERNGQDNDEIRAARAAAARQDHRFWGAI